MRGLQVASQQHGRTPGLKLSAVVEGEVRLEGKRRLRAPIVSVHVSR